MTRADLFRALTSIHNAAQRNSWFSGLKTIRFASLYVCVCVLSHPNSKNRIVNRGGSHVEQLTAAAGLSVSMCFCVSWSVCPSDRSTCGCSQTHISWEPEDQWIWIGTTIQSRACRGSIKIDWATIDACWKCQYSFFFFFLRGDVTEMKLTGKWSRPQGSAAATRQTQLDSVFAQLCKDANN